MADTVTISVPMGSWVDVTNSGTDGLITNEGSVNIRVFEDATQPADGSVTGHTLTPGDYIRFSVSGSQLVWARSIGNAASTVAVTIE